MLLPGSRENNVNSGVGVGEQNCNERVNGGDRETFTELGGESNVRSDFIESSDACTEGGESTESNGASDLDNLLGSKGALGAKSEDDDEDVRNIQSLYRKYKGEKTKRMSKDGGIEYVDSLDLGSHGSDSDGEVVYRRNRHGLMEEIFELLPRLSTKSVQGTPPPTRVPLAALTPPTAITHTSPAPFDPAPPAPSQTIASEASTSSPPAP
ncbi:hypothetical protein GOBAR_AA38171 [Gossypium barbadense]|uniref:Uncharacterized protein n=1 Tax=Gossypium barbadense TaxID=3634 RepID=A0A2P5VUM2_GOSBA|nr:hypothetical protein GOBAR_AA38171 [Gossypium barbadense]